VISASANGVIAQPQIVDSPQHLAWIDRHGAMGADLPFAEGQYWRGDIAPDGRRAAIEFSQRPSEPPMIWVVDLVRGTSQRMTFEGANYAPAWSPDGREIAFVRQVSSGSRNIWTMRADTPGSERLTVPLPNLFNTVIGYAPDGRSVVYRTQGTDTQQDMMLATFGEPPATRPLLATRFNELYGVVSPDGRSIAYLSDESGSPELYVRTFPAMTGQIRVSTNGAFVGSNSVTGISRPAWRPDGREIIYMAPDGRTVLTVDVRPGQPPDFGAPHPLFTLPSGVVDMMPAPDLGRFLLSLERRSSAPLSVRILMNWPALLDAAK
jgi:eukaryotic-like serine/threonine-protein kinase